VSYNFIWPVNDSTSYWFDKKNILGDPIARPPSNLTVRSEDDAYLQCPVAGYPITRTAWQKDMVSIPNHSRHTLFDNGTLFIRSTQDTVDSGLYVCTKINDRGQSATGQLYLRIMSMADTFLSFVLLFCFIIIIK